MIFWCKNLGQNHIHILKNSKSINRDSKSRIYMIPYINVSNIFFYDSDPIFLKCSSVTHKVLIGVSYDS